LAIHLHDRINYSNFRPLYRVLKWLLRKIRVGSKLRRKYSDAQTPLDRALASEVMDPHRAEELRALRQRLDPFELARTIDRKLQRISALADRRWSPKPPTTSVTF
jgi:hypothetical protein